MTKLDVDSKHVTFCCPLPVFYVLYFLFLFPVFCFVFMAFRCLFCFLVFSKCPFLVFSSYLSHYTSFFLSSYLPCSFLLPLFILYIVGFSSFVHVLSASYHPLFLALLPSLLLSFSFLPPPPPFSIGSVRTQPAIHKA